ncbi:MAG: hypothetical protein RIC55_12305 [Pirellulaceae bacterium]
MLGDNRMVTYRCPHCSAMIRHKPELAGDCVICSKCGGRYFEPTDPLPGVRPQIAPPVDEDPDPEESDAFPVAAAPPTSAPATSSSPTTSHGDTAPSPRHDSQEHALTQCQPQDMVAELRRRGLDSVLLSWPPTAREQAKMAFPPQLGAGGANEMILEVAFELIGARWPELRQLLENYRKQIR